MKTRGKKYFINQSVTTTLLSAYLLVYPQIGLSKNLPKTIEHEHIHTSPANAPKTPNQSPKAYERQQQDAKQQVEKARKNLEGARQDSRRVAPYRSTPYDNSEFNRLQAESELIRAQQELRDAQGNQYSLERRIESAERDAQLQRDRDSTRSPQADFQRSYPKIEYGHRARR